MKKQLLFIASLLFSLGANSQATWVSQATGFSTVSTGVRNVSAVDSNNVWIATYDGSGGTANRTDFSRTTDGGATWTPGTTPAPSNYNWSMIYGIDAMNAWALYYDAVAGSGGGLWHTSDGGATWAQQGTGTIYNASSFPDVVHFWNANEGITFGDPNPSTDFEIYTTVDGGTTWVQTPAASIPNALAGEYGIVAHYNVIGNTIWFDTNKGRVFKSTDKGLTWTVSSTGITVPANNAIDICFYDANNGLARLYNQTSGLNTSIKRTTNGGATWTTGTATGNMFGSDLKYIPGTTSKLLSTGAAIGFIGSSFSYDGGLTWTDIETSAQRTAIGVVDSNTMWCGGFTTSDTTDGIFKYEFMAPVACSDPNINAGTTVANDSVICFGDTLILTTTGAFGPTVGAVHGFSLLVSNIDISGNNDPLSLGSAVILGGTGVIIGTPPSTSLINTGAPFAAGVYYFTPLVYGNASGSGSNITFYTLDSNCTTTGNSVMVNLLPQGSPLCTVGINHIQPVSSFSVSAALTSTSEIDLQINSLKTEKAFISICDLTGRSVFTGAYPVAKGINHVMINAEKFAAGAYIIKTESAGSKAVTKLVK